MITAPRFRRVEQFSGSVCDPETEFELMREENAALRCRIQELEGEQ